MNTRCALVLSALGALSLAACSQGPAAPETEIIEMPGEQAQEFARLLREFDPVGVYNLLTENARLLPPNQPAIEGRQAIVDYYKGSVDNALGFEVAPQTRVMLGNVGIAEGSYKVRNTQTGEYIEDGKFLTVWVNEDGQWKLARLMTNTDYKTATPEVEIGAPAP